jgi:hypothetical protein
MRFIRKKILTKENLYALILCAIVTTVIIMSTNTTPLWIYQGF